MYKKQRRSRVSRRWKGRHSAGSCQGPDLGGGPQQREQQVPRPLPSLQTPGLQCLALSSVWGGAGRCWVQGDPGGSKASHQPLCWSHCPSKTPDKCTWAPQGGSPGTYRPPLLQTTRSISQILGCAPHQEHGPKGFREANF